MNETTKPHCHRNPDGERVLRTHHRDCESSGCEGCQPCRERHCGCGRHLDPADLHCPRCVGEVRNDLTRIADLCNLTTHAAIEHPTLTALDLAGPVADPISYDYRRRWVLGGALCECVTCPDLQPRPHGPACEKCAHQTCKRIRWEPTCPGLVDWLDNADDERHPLWVLGTWDMLVTEHLGHNRTNRVTVPSAAAYLTANLTDLSRDPDIGFDELARELRTCRDHVETVLAVAPYVHRGAPCPMCGRANLEKDHGATEDEDRWACPRKHCEASYTERDYRDKVEAVYVAHADRLTASQIAQTYRVPEGTVRRWASEGNVRRHGYDGLRRQLYDVGDTLRMRDGDTDSSRVRVS